jgi:hypothetical protein
MKKKMKKTLIIILSLLGIIFATLLVLPYVFKDKIMKLAKEQVNEMLNARVDFEKLNMSFIRNFPNATVGFENLSIVGVGEFANDTLLHSEDVDLVLNLKSLFSDTGYEIRKLTFVNAHVLAHILPNGTANWNIMKEDSTQLTTDTSAMNFNLKLKEFVIKNSSVTYWDEEGSMKAVIKNLNHKTSGNLTADSSLLVTSTNVASLTFTMDGVDYLSKATASLDADINANLNKMIFTFSENTSLLNAIPFSFSGWFQMLDEGFDMDLTLNTEKVDFKAILSMIPAIYANSFEDIKAGGDVNMSGYIKGKMIGDYYPAFDLKLKANNGWFQYPDLPKSVQNISIAGHINNPGKTLDATVIDISNFSFVLGGNPFSAQMRIAYPMTDPELTMKAIGKIDLGMIKEVYPLDESIQLNGILDMKLDLAGRMSYYDNNQYDKFLFGGDLSITDLLVKMSALPQDLSIDKANVTFNNQFMDLTSLKMKIGRNDISANGKLENFVAYALYDKTLKGVLNLQSNYFNVNDFMTSSEPDQKNTTETTTVSPTATDTSKLTVIVIPKNIDFSMQANFKQLVYGNMNFTNAKGILRILDGDMKIQDMAVNSFGGNMTMNGIYSTTNPDKPTVNFDFTVNDVLFTEVFKQVESIQKFAPIFEKATGKFSTKFSINSLLKSDMMPDLASLIGNGSFSTKSVGVANVPALSALASSLKRPEISNSTIKDLGVYFQIRDGKVNTKPFDIVLGGVKMNVGGFTSLDKTIAYTGKVQLPDKLNVGKLSTVNIKIGGTFSKPKVELDLKNMLHSAIEDAKANIKAEIVTQVDNAKEKAIEEVRFRKEQAIKEAQEQAERLRSEAKKAGERIILEAKNQGDVLISKSTNPITKKVAQTAANKLMEEANQKAIDLNSKAENEATKLIQKAENIGN